LDRTGLLAKKIADSVVQIDRGRKWLDTDGLEHEGRISYKDGLVAALEAFKEAQNYADTNLEIPMRSEYAFINQELHFCDPADKRTITSLKKGVLEFDEAFLALAVLQNAEAYKTAGLLFSSRSDFRYYGMPKDCFHIACSADITRLGNNLSTPGVNLAEKMLWEQRIANLKKAQSIYLLKQKKALGVA